MWVYVLIQNGATAEAGLNRSILEVNIQQYDIKITLGTCCNTSYFRDSINLSSNVWLYKSNIQIGSLSYITL